MRKMIETEDSLFLEINGKFYEIEANYANGFAAMLYPPQGRICKHNIDGGVVIAEGDIDKITLYHKRFGQLGAKIFDIYGESWRIHLDARDYGIRIYEDKKRKMIFIVETDGIYFLDKVKLEEEMRGGMGVCELLNSQKDCAEPIRVAEFSGDLIAESMDEVIVIYPRRMGELGWFLFRDNL